MSDQAEQAIGPLVEDACPLYKVDLTGFGGISKRGKHEAKRVLMLGRVAREGRTTRHVGRAAGLVLATWIGYASPFLNSKPAVLWTATKRAR
jgi:hypothetical protein